MKKQIENEVIENVVMDQETMQAIVDDNINIVPRNQRRKFESLTLEQKVEKLKSYQEHAMRIERWKMMSTIDYKVKELFEKKHGTVEDAKAVIRFCTEFIDNYKVIELQKLDDEIARLEEMKRNIMA